MATVVIENVNGTDIPPQWSGQIKDTLDSTFTLIIKKRENTQDKPHPDKWEWIADRFATEHSLKGKSEDVNRLFQEFRERYI